MMQLVDHVVKFGGSYFEATSALRRNKREKIFDGETHKRE